VLRIDGHGYSPAVLDKIVSAGADCKSFSHAAAQLEKLAEISVSQSHISNLTHEIGRELIAVRDHQAALHRHRQLPPDPGQPPIDLACVETDGGRLMTRAAEKPRGIHDKQWKEPKVGVLWRMKGETFPEDPHPELPRCFQQRESVKKLVREVHGTSSKGTDESDHGITLETITGRDEESTSRDGACQPGSGERRQWQPQRVFRTCVATLLNVYGFGPLVAAEAQRRGFYQAQRKVFLGDGQEANWIVHRLHFPDFTAVTDFMHAVGYAYAAAQATTTDAEDPWERYLNDATACWQGRVDEVIAELQAWLEEHPLPRGMPLKEISDTDPRKIVHETLSYFQNNRERMNYPEYRCQGMPVTSSLVESLIKELNWRVKGTEKFWNRPDAAPTSRHTGHPVRGREHTLPDMSAESILPVRAALLCDDDRLEKYITTRPGSPYVRRPAQTPNATSYADTAL
jgi:hypothetical protein